MDTSVVVLGSALMGVGILLVLVGVFRDVGPFFAPPWHLLALTAAGFALMLLGQWLLR